MKTMTIRETTDYKTIARLNEEVQTLHAQLYPEMFKPYNQEAMERALQGFMLDTNCKCYVVTQNGFEIGCAVFFIKEAKENAFHYNIKTLYIDQISVLSKYRRSGAGKLLMEQAEKLAREHNIRKIELDHWSANQLAASYFRTNGYKLYRERLFKVID